MKHPLAPIALLVLLILGCSLVPVLFPTSATVMPASSATAMPTSTFLPGYVPHRIGVRVVAGVGEFYDRLSAEKFVPRGYNYVRLAPIHGTTGRLWEATLSPGFYDPALAEEALQEMHADGYNVVRVYVDCCRTSNNVGGRQNGLSAAYMDNVVDFLERAKANDIDVLLVLHLTPADGPYNERWEAYRTIADGPNLRYLTAGGFEAKRFYDRAFIRELIRREAPLDAVFAYDLTDDVVYDAGQPPLTWRTGTVSTANGKTYDMANPGDKVQMMRENLLYWIDEQRAAILRIDPTALVTVSFPALVARSRPTYPDAAIWESTADFVDLHIYLGVGFELEDYALQFGIDGMAEKPIIAGQFAAFREGFRDAASAAQALQVWQGDSCLYGFDGWLLWLRGSEEYTALYNGLTEGGVINDALAPVNRPDPCQRDATGESPPG